MTRNVHEQIDCNSEAYKDKPASLFGNLPLFIDLHEALEYVLDNKADYQQWTNCQSSIVAVELVRNQLEKLIHEAIQQEELN